MNIDEYESLPTGSVAVHMTAGAIAGVMEHCVMYPLDSVKVNNKKTKKKYQHFSYNAYVTRSYFRNQKTHDSPVSPSSLISSLFLPSPPSLFE